MALPALGQSGSSPGQGGSPGMGTLTARPGAGQAPTHCRGTFSSCPNPCQPREIEAGPEPVPGLISVTAFPWCSRAILSSCLIASSRCAESGPTQPTPALLAVPLALQPAKLLCQADRGKGSWRRRLGGTGRCWDSGAGRSGCGWVETVQQSLSFDGQHILCGTGMYQGSSGTAGVSVLGKQR